MSSISDGQIEPLSAGATEVEVVVEPALLPLLDVVPADVVEPVAVEPTAVDPLGVVVGPFEVVAAFDIVVALDLMPAPDVSLALDPALCDVPASPSNCALPAPQPDVTSTPKAAAPMLVRLTATPAAKAYRAADPLRNRAGRAGARYSEPLRAEPRPTR
jgi:hypothetical protein